MKRRNLIFLLLPLLLAGCQSYKKVPYLQNDLGQIASADTSTRSMTLYDARIMPKDLLTIVVSCPEEPELAEPFNLTIATPASNTGNRSLTSQPALQQYLVDNDGNVEFPVLGTIHLGGLTKGDAVDSHIACHGKGFEDIDLFVGDGKCSRTAHFADD